MKANEFITEENIWSDEVSLEKSVMRIQEKYGMDPTACQMALAIRDKCQPYIKRVINPITQFPLYRGIHAHGKLYLAKKARLDNRLPLETDPQLHKDINQFFQTKFGAPFRNSVFCSGNFMMAGEYGDEYIIFPIGEFQTLWSPDVKDIWVTNNNYEYSKKFHRNVTNREAFIKAHNMKLDKPFDETHLVDVLDSVEYRTGDLRNGIKSGHEIMLRCKEYLCVSRYLDDEVLKGIEVMILI